MVAPILHQALLQVKALEPPELGEVPAVEDLRATRKVNFDLATIKIR